MSEAKTSSGIKENSVECILALSEAYVETVCIQAIDAQPGLVEFLLKTQLLNSKNPLEWRVKSRTCMSTSQLSEVRDAINRFLSTSSKVSSRSSGEPVGL